MFKIWDKVRVDAKNEDEKGEDFLYFGIIDGIQIKEEWNRYTMWGRAINTKITKKCTKTEITKHFA